MGSVNLKYGRPWLGGTLPHQLLLISYPEDGAADDGFIPEGHEHEKCADVIRALRDEVSCQRCRGLPCRDCGVPTNDVILPISNEGVNPQESSQGHQ